MTIIRETADRRIALQRQSDAIESAPFRYTTFSKRAAKFTIAFDMWIILIAGFSAIILRWGVITRFSLGLSQGFDQIFLVILIPSVWFLSLAWVNAWVFSGLASPSELYVRVLKAGMLTLGTVAGISFTFKANFSRGYVLLSILIGTALLLMQRGISQARFKKRCLERGIVKNYFVLTCCTPGPLVTRVQADFPDALCQGRQIEDDATNWIPDLKQVLLSRGVDALVLCSELSNDSSKISQIVRMLDEIGCELYLPDALGVMAQRRGRAVQRGNAYSVLTEPRIQHSQAQFKRVVDIALASMAIILLAPSMAIIALSIKLTSKGSILYKDYRIGQNGEEFLFPKFRTMHEGADNERLSILGRPDGDMTSRYRTDPRVTPFGKFLRRYSLDEIPQLWCVLVGTMSIVGPRPILKQEIPQLQNADSYRHLARPGLTGLWQVSGRKETTWEERMALDLEYIQNWSPFIDAVLVLRTFRVVITGRGAY